MLKRSQCSLTSIIRSSAQRWFNANNKHLLAAARCSIALSKFKVVSNKIPKYLKVYTCSITSLSNINSWHGLAESNTTTFVFFTFTANPRSAQNYWSTSNCCYSPTSDSNVIARSSAKNNIHTCMFAKANASHFLPSKCPFRASKYSPNSRGLRGQPYFTPSWHLKLEVTRSFGWLMHRISLAYIACSHRKKCPSTPKPANTCHSTSHDIVSNAFLKSTKQ